MLKNLDAILSGGAVCPLVFAVLVLTWIGSLAVHTRPKIRSCGQRLAGLMLLLWLGRAGVFGKMNSAEALCSTVMRGLLLAGLTLGVSWLALPFAVDLYLMLVRRPAEAIERGVKRIRDRIRAFFRRGANRLRAVKERWTNARAERKRRKAEKQQEAERDKQTEADRTRADVRLQCELFYDQHAPDLRDRFPKQRLDAYFQEYLGNNHPPELVEQRADLLLRMLKESLGGAAQTKRRFSSLEEIASHFADQRKQLEENSQLDGETKDTIVRALNQQEDDAIEEFLNR